MSEVDKLEVKIEADAKKANSELDSLVKKLQATSRELGKINSSGLGKLVSGMKKDSVKAKLSLDSVNNSMRNIGKKVKTPKVDVDVKSGKQAIKSLQNDFKNVGKNVSYDGNLKSLEKQYGRLSKELDKLSEKEEKFLYLGKATTANDTFKSIEYDIAKTLNKMDALVAKMKEASTASKGYSNVAEIPIYRYNDNVPKMDSSSVDNFAKNVEKSFAKVPESAKYSVESAQKSLQAALSKVKEDESIDSYTKKIADAKQQLKDLEKSGKGMGVSEWDNAYISLQKVTEEAKEYKAQLDKKVSGIDEDIKKTSSLGNEVENLNSDLKKLKSQGFNFGDTNFDKVYKELIKTQSELKSYKSNLASVKSESVPFQRRFSNTFAGITKNIKFSNSALVSFFKNMKSNLFVSNKTSTGFGGLTSKITKLFFGVKALKAGFDGLKSSIDFASDLKEVQNVVDVAFGKYSKGIENLSKTSIKDFGMSELTAKQIAGRFQAMGTAVGFSQKKMSGMSVELTKLAADMASFYNVDQEKVAKSLQSVFTGTTQPLRKYGVDLTQATLEEWAHKQGVDANMKSMSQAEKTMLRYQYVISQTSAAQGDFARTSDTWANQTRILKQNFQQLGAIIGTDFINALKPMVKSINSIMGQVINFAEVISNALGKIFGWKYESGGGVVQDYSDDLETVADNADKTADATDKAADAQKEFNKQLQGFDKLNNLTTSNSSSGKGDTGKNGSGSGDLSGLDGSGGKWVAQDSVLKSFKSDIDSLEELGGAIADALSKAMESIDWDNIYEKAKNFGSGLASFLNGLFTGSKGKRLFENTGRTIASAINTSMYAVNEFAKDFKWKSFGNNLASGLNSFFKTWDANLTASTFNNLSSGVLDAAVSAINKVRWKQLKNKIFGFVNGLDFPKTGWKLGKLVSSLSNAVYDIVSDKKAWSSMGDNIAKGINNFFKANNWEKTGKAIGNSIGGIITAINSALKGLSWIDIGIAIGNFISGINFKKIAWNLTELAKSLITGIGSAIAGSFTTAPIETGLAVVFGAIKASNVINDSKTLQSLSDISSELIAKLATKIAGKEISLATVKIATGTTFQVLGITAVVGLVAGAFLKKWSEKNIDLDLANINVNSESINSARDKIKQSLSDMKITLENIDLDYEDKASELEGLSKRFYDLSQKTNRTKTESDALKDIYNQLVDKMPEIKGQVDEQTKAYKGTKKELNALVTKTKAYYTAQAGQEKLVEIAKSLFKAKTQLNKAEKSYGKQLSKIQKYNEKIKSLQEKIAYYTDISYDEDKVNDLNKELGKYETLLGDANAELKNNKKSLDDAKKSYNEINKEYDETNNQLDEMSGNIEKLSSKKANPSVTLTSNASEKIADIDSKIKKLEDKKAKISISGDGEDAKKKIAEIDEKIDKLKGKKVKIQADNSDAKTKIQSIDDKIKKLEEKKLKIKGDNSDAKQKIKAIDEKIDKLKAKKAKVSIKATVDVEWNQKWKGKTVKSSIPSDVQDWIVKQKYSKKAGGGLFKNGSWHNITKYASGGSPNMGEMFVAREKGPELVGKIGSHTAVVNNDQIVASVSDGVFNALNPVLSQMVVAINKMNSSVSGTPLYVQGVSEGDIVKITKDANSDYKKRYGKPLFT